MGEFHSWLDTALLFAIAVQVGSLKARVTTLEFFTFKKGDENGKTATKTF